MNEKLKNMLEESLYVHKEIKENSEDGAYFRWENKKVFNSKTIYDGSTIDNVNAKSCAQVSLSDEFVKTGKTSLKIKNFTSVENVVPRPWPGVVINVPEFDLSKYNRVVVDAYIKATGYQNFYIHFNVSSPCEYASTAMSLEVNKWCKVVWEIDDLKREKCSSISISPWLMGCPDEALPEYELYIDNVRVEQVVADHVLGWEAEDRICYSHAGYFLDSKKVALIGAKVEDKFKIEKNGKIVLEKGLEEVCTDLGKFYLMDFSEIREEGEYKLVINENYQTHAFLISDTSYDESIWKSMNFLRLLRCGEDIEGVHSACHLNCRTMHEDGSSVPNFGGWHDAGDVSQFEIPTAEMAHAIVDLALQVKDKNRLMYERLKEEARVGLNWLLRTRFNDGYRAMAITYNIWRKSVLASDNKTVYSNKAETGPFENFCASAAEAKAYLLYKDSDKVFAEWCLRAGKEDFEFAKDAYEKGIHTARWGSNVDSQVAGHGALAASELYRATNEEYYLVEGEKYGDIILACQETEYIGESNKLRGFFYEDPKHTFVMSFEHRGHEQSPVQGLVNLCSVYKNSKNYDKWMKGIKLYRDYVLDSMSFTSPYNLLPGHVYIKDKINIERFTIGRKEAIEGINEVWAQAQGGIKLNDEAYLRIFPAAPERRGFHATMLSKAKAVSLMAKLLDDNDLRQIAIDQLEWILGKNPFASSTMFGCGYNYHPLYVAFSRQMVGALPVGIKTKGNLDVPYWPTRDNAVYKEIWGHTTGKYLWVLADLLR